MIRRVLASVVSAVLLAIRVAHADPRFEASGFLGVDLLGTNIGLGNSYAPDQVPGSAPMLGARVGYFPFLADPAASDAGDPELELGVEAELAFAPAFTAGDPSHQRDAYFAPVFAWRAQLQVRLAGNTIRPFLIAGAGGNTVASSSPYMDKESDPIYYWGPGVALPITDAVALRFDLRQGITPGRDGWTATYEMQMGLSTTFGPAEGKPKKVVEVVAPPVVTPPVAHDEDRDGDGIPDRLDKCPKDKETVNGVEDEDGCPEADPDGDGIVGARDKCPNEAEDFDHFEDEDGCPDLDNDRDGIPDQQDACPNQPETKNGIDDADGCPDKVPDDLAQAMASVTVHFEKSRARVTAPTKKELVPLVAALRKYRDVKIVVFGHPAKAGDGELARRRADGVKWYLVDQGVVADRIATKVGDADPRVVHVELAAP